MKNSISDLSTHLFGQLETILDNDLKGNKLDEEIKRTRAVVNVSSEIIKAGTLQYKSVRLALENKSVFKAGMLPMIKTESRELIGTPAKTIDHD